MPIEIIKRNKNGMFYFRVKAKNGTILAESEDYTSSAGVYNGVRSLCEQIADYKLKSIFEIEIKEGR